MIEANIPRPTATSSGETQTSAGVKKRWLRTRLFGALVGAAGFGLELDRAIGYSKHPKLGDDLSTHFLMGFIFLAIAVQNSVLLIYQMRELQDIAKE